MLKMKKIRNREKKRLSTRDVRRKAIRTAPPDVLKKKKLTLKGRSKKISVSVKERKLKKKILSENNNVKAK